jgi:hypothetical protein
MLEWIDEKAGPEEGWTAGIEAVDGEGKVVEKNNNDDEQVEEKDETENDDDDDDEEQTDTEDGVTDFDNAIPAIPSDE